jgi:hypothetical protein
MTKKTENACKVTGECELFGVFEGKRFFLFFVLCIYSRESRDKNFTVDFCLVYSDPQV